MARRRYLIAYDIADPVRLRAVCKLMEAYGRRLQYSVFLCDLSRAELATWEMRIRDLVVLSEDSIIRLDLGPMATAAPITTLGVPRKFPEHGSQIY